ncbi:MAG: hypothetical protein JNM24_00335 [Bdellovibrionaceae bacterium]|nr:hypothetical protein [Pseudobdellovibrionaceae bacterium]
MWYFNLHSFIKKIFSIVLAIFLTVVWPQLAMAGLFSSQNHCVQFYSEKKTSFYGRLKGAWVQFASSKEDIYRQSSYYNQAKNFTKSYGYDFVRFVENELPRKGRTVIAVIMGGSEHLGTILREYQRMGSLKNVDIKEVWLNRSIAGSWKIERRTQVGSIQGEPRYLYGSVFPIYTEIPIYKYEYLIGALDLPMPKITNADRVIEKNQSKNTIEQLVNYSQSIQLWNYDNILVVDTGFHGAMPNVVAQLAEKVGFQGFLKGVMYTFAQDAVLNLKLPVVGYAQGNERTEKSLWAYSIDTGQDIDQVVQKNLPIIGTVESARIFFEANRTNSFQRSRPKVSQLVQMQNGLWQPDKGVITDSEMVENWRLTVQGIREGLQEKKSWLWERSLDFLRN